MDSETASVVFRRLTSRSSLMQIFLDNVDKKTARGRDGISPAIFKGDLNSACKNLSAKLRTGGLEFTQYREALKSKGAGKNPRVVSIPTVRDRVALRALAEVLGRVYPHARGVIPQEKINLTKSILQEGKFDTFIRLDVEDFYPSICHKKVEERLRRRIRKPEIISLTLKAIRTPTVPDRAKKKPNQGRGVPQGLAISNILAELVSQPIDAEMQKDPHCAYVRFVDDVLILCNKEHAEALTQKATDLFRHEGLTVHDHKNPQGKSQIGPIIQGFDYLGYWFKNDRITVRSSSIHKVESALARAFTRYVKSSHGGLDHAALARCKWKVNLIITGCVYKKAARGWLHYFRQMDDLTLLKRLDATVDRFIERFDLLESFRPKRFMRTYWQIQGGRHLTVGESYIPNFDLVPLSQMRAMLASILGYPEIETLSDNEVRIKFDKLIGKAVAELEADIGFVS